MDTRDDAVIWHDTENGSYGADLPHWRELAAQAGGPVLELGCGTGRAALDLARHGSRTLGVDIDERLVGAFNGRAADRGLDARAVVGDMRDVRVGGRYPLVIVPMQSLQLLEDSDERYDVALSVRETLAENGLAGFAIVEGDLGAGSKDVGLSSTLPDLSDVDGWVYSSLPLDIETLEERIVITRLRQVVAPDGDLDESRDETSLAILTADSLAEELAPAGLVPAGTRKIADTELHVGSTIALFEVAP